jgi:NAD(P)-dependent dehydrogenase (short-subunit alcohol dehydrogenase family)
MDINLKHRAILVTGAAQGLGLGIARRLAAAGARLVLVDRDPAVKDRLADPLLTNSAIALVRDLAEPDAARDVMRSASEKVGVLDGLVNCAAWSFHKPFSETTISEFDHVVAINQRAPFFLSQEFAKGALVAMGRAMAVELAPRIRVVTISPSAILTKNTENLIAEGQVAVQPLLNRYLVKRFITVEEVADLVAFLFGSSARSITGCNWIIDGGLTAQ